MSSVDASSDFGSSNVYNIVNGKQRENIPYSLVYLLWTQSRDIPTDL